MSDTSNPFGGFSSFFFPNEQGTNLKLREKIALAQMMKKQAYPKTLGEGFASIGDSISDIITMRGLEKSDREAQLAASKLGAPKEAGEITPVSSAPMAAAPVQAAAIAGGQDPTSQAPVPPSVQEGGPPLTPGPMFRPNLRTSPVMTPAAPAVPAPPDVPGAIRMSTPEQLADFRAQNPLPQNIPPSPKAPLPGPPPQAPQRPSVADYGQKLVLAPTLSDAPVMAKGPDPASLPIASPEDPRREIALAMLRQKSGQGAPGVSPVLPTPAPQGIEMAPPDAFQRVVQAQSQAVPGYVPPALADPTKAVVIQPSKRERELQLLLNANQGNTYAATGSPAAMELQDLQTNRAKQQALEDKKTEANISRATKRDELRQQGLMDQDRRILESRKSGIELGDLPDRLRQEALKRQQELIALPGQTSQSDPRLLGTKLSPQRTGIPEVDPVPPGISADVWQKSQEKKITADAATLETAKPELTEALNLLKQTREHPWKSASLGTGGKLAQMTAGGQGFAAMMEQLKGKNFLAGYQKLKGTGQISEIEGLKTEQAQARLNTAQNETDFNNALDDLETSMRGAVERAERKMKRPVTAYQKSPDDPYAPDLGQVGMRGGKQVEYIGGDPSKDSSYKTVRR